MGSLKPNPFGLYDMHGNVWEFCKDPFAREYVATGPVDDPIGPSTGSLYVQRGGSSGDHPWALRSAFRHINPGRDLRHAGLGFRLAAVPALQ